MQPANDASDGTLISPQQWDLQEEFSTPFFRREVCHARVCQRLLPDQMMLR
jgi:hypothetical protein